MKKIIIAEDDAFISDVAKQRLSDAGFEVTAVADGDFVLQTVQSSQPDVLLLDIDLPHVDGLTILKDIRADETLKELPVIVFTNNDDANLKSDVEALGATHFMKAVTGSEELVSAVQSVL